MDLFHGQSKPVRGLDMRSYGDPELPNQAFQKVYLQSHIPLKPNSTTNQHSWPMRLSSSLRCVSETTETQIGQSADKIDGHLQRNGANGRPIADPTRLKRFEVGLGNGAELEVHKRMATDLGFFPGTFQQTLLCFTWRPLVRPLIYG